MIFTFFFLKLKLANRRAEDSEGRMQDATKKLEIAESALYASSQSYEKKLNDNLHDIRSLREDKDELQNMIGELKAELEKAKIQIGNKNFERKEESNMDKQKIKQLESLVEELDDKLNVDKANISHLEERYLDTEEARKKLEIKVTEHMKEINLLHQSNNTLSKENENLGSVLFDLKRKIVLMNDKIIELQGNIRVFCRVRPVNFQKILFIYLFIYFIIVIIYSSFSPQYFLPTM